MAELTVVEIFGVDETGHSDTGLTTGGALRVIVVPNNVYDAGGLNVVAWVLNQLKAAQDADTGSPGVLTRQVTELSDGSIRVVWTVTLTASIESLLETDFEENVDDSMFD
jgi:hypothetical protein